MNIDYAAIIAKANERKDSLQRFEVASQYLKVQLRTSQPLLDALAAWKACHEQLDTEARYLLPRSSRGVEPCSVSLAMWVGNILSQWGAGADAVNERPSAFAALKMLVPDEKTS